MVARFFNALLLCVCCAFVVTAFAQIPESERQVLIEFYQTTGGDDWFDNDGWLGPPGSECDWFGVACVNVDDSLRLVRSLTLPANGLTGTLPESLPELGALSFLRLARNSLEGEIPASFQNFDKLNTIDLRGNRLDGPVPGELLTVSVSNLLLSGNQFDGYTPMTGEAGTSSMTLDLARNPLAALPPESWRSAGAIRKLSLAQTGLAGQLDFDKHPWPGLWELDLSHNAISALAGIDEDTLMHLRELDLANNQLDEHWPVSGDTLPWLRVLDLSANKLHSPPPANLAEHPALQVLRLGRNALQGDTLGPLFQIPTLSQLELQHNPLQGLPAAVGPVVRPSWWLDLSFTGLEGPPPDWFGELSLTRLNVAGNRLSGSPQPWMAALREDTGGKRLDLSLNQFSGPLPPELVDHRFHPHALNLCFNDFDQPFGQELDDFLETRHIGGNPANCNGRELADIDLDISGAWYDPDHDGKGYVVMLLDSGHLAYYWFGYPTSYTSTFEQKYSLQIVRPEGPVADFPRALAPHQGRFGLGLKRASPEDYDDGQIRLVRLADDRLSISSRLQPVSPFAIVTPPPMELYQRLEHVRLTELAGTRCDNQSPFQHLSGLWFDPERDGEGFVVLVLPSGHAGVYWFTFRPDGSGWQAWMVGLGPIEAPIIGTPPPDFPSFWVEIDPLIQPIRTIYGPWFDSDHIEMVDWGSLRLEFYRHGTARVFWDSNLEGYGSGDYPLQRLASPMLADCPDNAAD